MVRVLVVEDEPQLADALREALARESFAVDVAYDGGEALEKYAVHDYDVVVLDRDLPVVHGDDVCRAIVAGRRPTRVLMLTAASAVRARVEGLAIGADDYLVKPFALAELSARVHALARRTAPAAVPVLERAGLRVDQASRAVTRDGRPVALTNKEYAVLVELLRADGGVLSAEQLLEKVWDENIDPFTNTVRVTVMKLRRKLGTPQMIETLPAAGYRLS
ncbi:response regulator transcription factor [Frankia sp. CNm7]|uniref:Response regulator transcription factor n=1 Tax=Frankia nepalensis TaxID=1836974 RepID=A0A937RC48_9ACTN|nr:response regulator transcription factor [Frankia nepalensis]MBL7495773.1 response regulator transcription factor [Frankia nepalensis]MBL7513016.1 response regulator transcription factor [Frankia nepalensis]MBL7523638.1 response regulator transcription factor [Frankia nepalensis]MBL7627117.1 response regulator transcription factor [Frankia nepalensis]